MKTQHTPILFHPFASNPLDYVGKTLHNPAGDTVHVLQNINGSFDILMNGIMVEHQLYNAECCAILCKMKVGA